MLFRSNMVHEITLKNEPQYPEIPERHMALLMLDAVFHDVDAPKRPSVWDFHHKRTQLALEEIKTGTVKEGAMIWRLYNVATVVRTSSVTVGFDLTRGLSSGSESFALSESTMKDIIDQCDILFISHRHRDHADEWVAQAFIDQNKPVVAPPNVWDGLPIHSQMTHMEREPHKVQDRKSVV